MDWQARYYPLDVFDSLRAQMEALIAAGEVIALARVRGGIVVSQETTAAEKRNSKQDHYTPDVCRELGVPCINLLGLLRQQKWKL